MKVRCQNCEYGEYFDEQHQPPIIYCPYCGSKRLVFRREMDGKLIVKSRLRILRIAHWAEIFAGKRGMKMVRSL